MYCLWITGGEDNCTSIEDGCIGASDLVISTSHIDLVNKLAYITVC